MIEFLNAETRTPVLLINYLLEPTPARSADLGKQCVYTRFPKDRNCGICQRTKITRALRKNGELITADHKVLSEGCASRNNRRYAVVVQCLATQ